MLPSSSKVACLLLAETGRSRRVVLRSDFDPEWTNAFQRNLGLFNMTKRTGLGASQLAIVFLTCCLMGSGKSFAQDDGSAATIEIDGADQEIENQDSGAETPARNEEIIESVRQCHVRMLAEEFDKLVALYSDQSPPRVTKQEREERLRVREQEREAECGRLSL